MRRPGAQSRNVEDEASGASTSGRFHRDVEAFAWLGATERGDGSLLGNVTEVTEGRGGRSYFKKCSIATWFSQDTLPRFYGLAVGFSPNTIVHDFIDNTNR